MRKVQPNRIPRIATALCARLIALGSSTLQKDSKGLTPRAHLLAKERDLEDMRLALSPHAPSNIDCFELIELLSTGLSAADVEAENRNFGMDEEDSDEEDSEDDDGDDS